MIKNYTQHEVKITDQNGDTLHVIPSHGIARVPFADNEIGFDESVGVPIMSSEQTGPVTGLPPQKEGVYVVVSALVKLALPDRHDLRSPGPLIRNEQGQPVGCIGWRK